MKTLIAMVAAAVTTWTATASAQDYPTRPITMIVPFEAGGPTDTLARLVSEHMSRTLGQAITVENVSGAGGTAGSTRAFRAAPDGYTLVVGNLGSHAAARLYKNIQYDPQQFEPVGMIARTPMYLAVRKDFPAQTLPEFIDHVKKNPGKVTNGHAGVGSTSHLVCLFLTKLTGINMQSMAYRGTGPAEADLAAGKIDSLCDQAPTVVPQIRSGSIRGLVVAQQERSQATPDVPTAQEAGLPEFQATGWNAMFAPKRTPKPVIDKLSQALNAALTDEGVRRRIEELGSVPPAKDEATPQWLGDFVRTEVEKWGKVIQGIPTVEQ
ncbi:MAG: tripartite tricarboxylate transporter substrate-binding protein [Pseudomonadota bacterium]|nr:tripartite tricarboxylate transporter substrate-binding protein [Pseudomonadota bacterium]